VKKNKSSTTTTTTGSVSGSVSGGGVACVAYLQGELPRGERLSWMEVEVGLDTMYRNFSKQSRSW